VNKEFSAQLFPRRPGFRVRTGLRSIGVVLAGSALVAACAHLSLPSISRPCRFRWRPLRPAAGPGALATLAAATLGAYLAEGALGLPVFAPSP